MSGTLKELETELETELLAVKETLPTTQVGSPQNTLLIDLLAKVQNASKILQELGRHRTDWQLQKELKGSLLDIREAMKDPELTHLINPKLLDNLQKFFQRPQNSSNEMSMFNHEETNSANLREPSLQIKRPRN